MSAGIAIAAAVRGWRFKSNAAILAFAACLLVLLWGTVLVKLQAERDTEIADVMKDTANLARAFEEHTLRTIREADQVLHFMQDLHRSQGARLDLRRLVEDGPIIGRIYTYLSIIDEHGMLAAGSQPFKPTDLSDREHFKVHVGRDIGLFISKPVVGRASGRQSIQLSRRINKPDLSFGGVAVASIDPGYFSQFYGQLDLGMRGEVTLIGRDDRIVRARRAGEDITVGQDASGLALFAQLDRNKHGNYHGASELDGVSRIFSYRALADYPLVVAVGVATDEALAEFNQRARTYYQAAGLSSLAIVGFALLLLTMIRREENERRASDAARAEFASIVEQSNDAIISRSPDGRFQSWNAGAERMFGYTAAEAIGQPIGLILPPAERAEVGHKIERTLRGEGVAPYETRRLTKDGRVIDVMVSVSPIKDANSTVTSVSIIFHDIGERKRAEQALRESEQRFRAMFDHASVGITMRSALDRTRPWVQVNDRFCRLLGYTREELLQLSTAAITPPDEQAAADQDNVRLRRGEISSYVREKRILRKDGSIIWVDLSVAALPDAEGRPGNIIAVYQDITERKRAEAERARLAAIVESSNDAIVSRDQSRRISSWNAAASRLFGYTAEEMLGRDISILIPPDQQADAARGRVELAHGRPIAARDAVRLTKDGRRIDVSLTQSPIKDDSGNMIGVSIVFRDISEQKRIAREEGHKARLTQLLEALARAANEAATPEGAMRTCLDLVCEYGGWRLGHVGVFDPGGNRRRLRTSLWHAPDAGRWAAFMRHTDESDHSAMRGPFLGAVLGSKHPVWLTDISQYEEHTRVGMAAQAGLRAAFAFPVIAGGEVAAYLEFFAEEPREPDQLFLGAIESVGAQLSRLIDRERALSALRESEHQMRLVTEHMPAMIAYFDHDLRCRYANRGFCEFQHIDPERIIGMSLREITGEETYGVVSPSLLPVMQGKAATTRRVHRGDNGDSRHIEISRVPDMAADGGFRGYYAMLRDVTEQVRSEAAILASEARLRAILDNEPECVKVIDADGVLVEMNRSGLTMLEAGSLAQARRHGFANFVQPEYRERFAEFIGKCLGGESLDFEFEITGLKGTRRWLHSRAAPLKLPGTDRASLLVVTRDISERKRAQEQVEYLSNFDSVTRLPNRALFRDRLEQAVAHARRRGEALGVMLVNLDRFRKVNESLGHEAGDELLRQIAVRLKEALRDVDTISRFGGNDYAVLLEGIADVDDVTPVAEKLLQAMAAPFEVRGQEVVVSVSVGVAACRDAGCDAKTLLENAETAMSRTKLEGGNAYRVYENEPVTLRGRRLTIEMRLRHALENGELAVHYQPKVNLRTGAISGAEALVRWASPQLGQISPVQFIPVAEETGLIVPIGAWVLETACARAAAWRRDGHDIDIAVNLSPRQFRQKDLASTVARLTAQAGLDPRHLELEITEGTAMANADHTIAVLRELDGQGVRLAVDDFGTGYSSLGYLNRFPLRSLKIDRSFVRDAADDPNSQAIVRATIALAHSLNLKVVAEGIETEEQRDFLTRLECDEGQGYLYSKPLPEAEFVQLLNNWRGGTPGIAGAVKAS